MKKTERRAGDLKTEKTSTGHMDSSQRSRFRENAEAIFIAIVIALFIRTFVVQAFKIPSGSMKPTLQIGDHILVNKFSYGVRIPYLNTVLLPLGDPQRGDIVVFKYPLDPKKDFIKRVIGTPGDVVEIRDKTIYVNRQRLNHDVGVHSDPHTIAGNLRPRDNLGPITVPKGALFVMGDNRDESFDSRFWGFVPLRDVSGKAFIIYWSWDSDDFKVRWGRLAGLLR
ncbi:MAG TPA: signal peptidase I [Desulfobacterales bacterium]|nr:signal peptidase I [Desulfobacterales bacterium]